MNLEEVEVIRLFCDGCGGQNKNAHVIHILSYWLQNESPNEVKELILHFPVRGHSYLPADRVFGRVEKKLKNLVVIANPEEYNLVYSQVGDVKKVGVNWRLYDVKKLQETYNKVPGIKDFKRISIKKFPLKNNQFTVKYKGSAFFRYEDISNSYGTLLKKRPDEKKHKTGEKKSLKNFKNEFKMSKFLKYVKNIEKCQNSRKISKNVKIFEKCQKFRKMSKI